MSRLPWLHTYEQAAELLAPVEESWLRNNVRKLPHSKIGGVVFFTDDDIARIARDLYHVEPQNEPRTRASSALAAAVPSGPHPLADLKPRRASRRTRQTA